MNTENKQEIYRLRCKGIFRRIFKTSILKTLENALSIVKYVSYPFQTISNLNKVQRNGCLFSYSHQAMKQLFSFSLFALIQMFNAIFYFSFFLISFQDNPLDIHYTSQSFSLIFTVKKMAAIKGRTKPLRSVGSLPWQTSSKGEQ